MSDMSEHGTCDTFDCDRSATYAVRWRRLTETGDTGGCYCDDCAEVLSAGALAVEPLVEGVDTA